jgi:transposase-like protein
METEIMPKPRSYTAEEKMRIIEEGRAPGATVAQVCRRHQISDGMFYKWESAAKAGMLAGLSRKKRGKSRSDSQVEDLEKEIQRKNDVIAQLTEALIQEKKGLSDYLRRSD